MEDYWKKDDFYYHPMFHKLNITYNRFVLLLKNWHVADNQTAPTDDWLYKVADFVQKLISKFQAVYHPGKEVAVDETMISRRGRLLFRQYNPGKAHKYGIKLFKLCEMTGYIWNFSIYCGKGTSEIVDGSDHPGSLLVSLAAPLLNEGRLIVADNWYSSIPLAKYLQQRNTEYCGTLRKNISGLPSQLKSTKVKKNDSKGVINSDGIRVVKYKDQRDVYMISTFHGVDTEETGRSNRHGEAISKPTVIMDYNRVKGGIDLSDQMIAYYSPAHKSVKWFRKVLMKCICMAVAIDTTMETME